MMNKERRRRRYSGENPGWAVGRERKGKHAAAQRKTAKHTQKKKKQDMVH
jgi:hypothetical protein